MNQRTFTKTCGMQAAATVCIVVGVFLCTLPIVVSAMSSAAGIPSTAATDGDAQDPNARKNSPPFSCNDHVRTRIKDLSRPGGDHHESLFQLAVLRNNEPDATAIYGELMGSRAQDTRSWRADNHSIDNRRATLQLALDNAALANHPNIIQFLITHGARPNYTSEVQGVPAMVIAARCENVDSLKALYRNEANPNIRTYAKDLPPTAASTPLENAVSERRNDTIAWLLAHGIFSCSSKEAARLRAFLTKPALDATTRTIDSENLQRLDHCTRQSH